MIVIICVKKFNFYFISSKIHKRIDFSSRKGGLDVFIPEFAKFLLMNEKSDFNWKY